MATTTGFLRDNQGIYIPKDADAILTYSIDWSDWLTNGETISSNTYDIETISGDTDALEKTAQSNSDTVTTVKVSGGTVGNIYKVYNTIVTSGGLTERRYFRIRIDERSL